MVMCVYKFISTFLIPTCYRVVVGGGGPGADSGIYYRGAPCIGEGLGGGGQGMSPPEAPGN